ncbi:MAG: DUF4160 domain-containing protein [Defluviitaleaceae bacterium]|nr:DUF4160 domain-containing protein [Defluviitaleaceae bacterium]
MSSLTVGWADYIEIYFTTYDKDEPSHAHANYPVKVEAGSAKIWIMINGETEVASAGKLSAKELKKTRRFLKENHMVLFKMWEDRFGKLNIYGEPEKEFTVTKDKNTGELSLQEKGEPKLIAKTRLTNFKQKYGITEISPAFEESIVAFPENVWRQQEPIFAKLIKEYHKQ